MISCSKTSATIRKTFKTKPPLEALLQTPPRESLPWNPIPQKHFMFLQKYKGSREIISLAGCGAEPHERMASFL